MTTVIPTPTEEELVSAEVLRWMLEAARDGERFVHHGFAIEQMDGAHASLVLFFTDMAPVRDAADAARYVCRLRALGGRFRGVCGDLELQCGA